jgi:hypothetical protein
MVQGAIREAHEESGVLIDPADLAFSHVVHHRNPESLPRIGFFFTAVRRPLARRASCMVLRHAGADCRAQEPPCLQSSPRV